MEIKVNFNALYKNGENWKQEIVLTREKYLMQEDVSSKTFSFSESLEKKFISTFVGTLSSENPVQKITIEKNGNEIFILNNPIIHSFINIQDEELINFLSCTSQKG